MVAPIPVIEADLLRLKKDNKQKMSALTLRYLKDKGIISSDQFVTYNWAHDIPKDRTIVTEKNVVEWVNLKFVGLYELI